MTVAGIFAEFASALRPDAVPEAALHGARRCLVDWWGAAVAGTVGAASTSMLSNMARQPLLIRSRTRSALM